MTRASILFTVTRKKVVKRIISLYRLYECRPLMAVVQRCDRSSKNGLFFRGFLASTPQQVKVFTTNVNLGLIQILLVRQRECRVHLSCGFRGRDMFFIGAFTRWGYEPRPRPNNPQHNYCHSSSTITQFLVQSDYCILWNCTEPKWSFCPISDWKIRH